MRTIWYHQVGAVVDPSAEDRREILQMYAQVARYPVRNVDCRGPCSGLATTFSNERGGGTYAFVVELSRQVTASELERNVHAAYTIFDGL